MSQLKMKFKLKEIWTCDICFKTFITDKSLHGHMKVHPQRNYRGMLPPKKSSRPIITTYSDDQVVAGCSGSTINNGRADLTGVLSRGWPAEFRRGRTCDGSGTGKMNEDELLMDAAYALMFLSSGDERYRSLPPSNKKQRISGDGGKVEMMTYTENGDDNVGISSKKRKRRNNEMSSYTCGTCGKSFGSPQALGGHTSSGHGIKNAVSEQVLMEGERGVSSDAKCMSSAYLHVCKECNKAFSSGQALGGHMSSHSKAPTGAVAAAVVVVEEDGQVGGNNQVFRCFDLNEIPADDD